MKKYFGTDGIRGVAGTELTSATAYRLGRFLGQYEQNSHQNNILIARDTRLSGYMLEAALISGLTTSGANVTTLSVSPTPSVSYLVAKHHFDYGIIISASHNPYYDNGIKVFNRHGEKLDEKVELLIEKYIDQDKDDLPLKDGKKLGSVTYGQPYIDEYIDFIVSKAEHDFSHLKLLIDTAHGSASKIIEPVLKKLNIKADVINNEPNGYNINDLCGSTHIKNLKDHMIQNGYDLGLTFDGDADRLLMINHHGQVIDGDAMLYLSAVDKKKKGLLDKNKIVITVMSNIGLKLALKKQGIDIIEVDVGDRNVQLALKKHQLVLGGEQSGHIIFYNELNTGDGLLSMIKMLNIIASSPLDINGLLKDYIVYPQVLKNVVVQNKKAVMEHPKMMALISEINEHLRDTGRILVRPSGTECLIRIMVEAESEATCQQYVNQVYTFINEAFIN